MSLSAINPDAVRQFVSPRDPNYERWRTGQSQDVTIFSLRALSARELASVFDATQEIAHRDGTSRAIRVDLHRRYLMLVEAALVGWHNFADERGNPITFELESASPHRPHLSARSLDALAPWLVRELGREVLRDSMLDETSAKNSAAS